MNTPTPEEFFSLNPHRAKSLDELAKCLPDDFPPSAIGSWLAGADRQRIKAIPCLTDAMAPTIQMGDMVFVDTFETRFEGDGIYLVMWGGHLLLKRLQALYDGRLAVHCDNREHYETEYVPASQVDQLMLGGRVVALLQLRTS